MSYVTEAQRLAIKELSTTQLEHWYQEVKSTARVLATAPEFDAAAHNNMARLRAAIFQELTNRATLPQWRLLSVGGHDGPPRPLTAEEAKWNVPTLRGLETLREAMEKNYVEPGPLRRFFEPWRRSPEVNNAVGAGVEHISREGNPSSSIFNTIVTPKKIKELDERMSGLSVGIDDMSGDDL